MLARGRLLFVASIVALAWALPSQASARFHLISIVEVFGGTEAEPDAQYVVLQMYAANQDLVGGHSIVVYDASDRVLGTYTFTGPVPNGANQDRILIATAEAESFFDITADLAMDPVMPADGGRVCFDLIDCVAWGEYPMAAGSGDPFSPDVGLVPGTAAVRRLDIAGGATTLEAADNTFDSANDFRLGAPSPRNNARETGTVPPSTCGDGMLEGLESCDDGDTTDDAVCPGSCILRCGDGVIAPMIECEPPRTAVCSGICRAMMIDAGPPPDPDAGLDAPEPLDAGPPPIDDAGIDAPIPDEDAGSDAPEPLDAGELADAGIDAGTTPVDTGAIDAGSRDVGIVDAPRLDGGADAGGGAVSTGCGCRAGRRDTSGAVLALLAVLGAIGARRRR